MKKPYGLALLFALVTVTGAAAPLRIVTTTSDLASIAGAVGGDLVDVKSIARGYQDPHFVEPKPSYLLLLRDAELLMVVGLDLESAWLPPLLDQSRNPRIRPGATGYLDVSRGVEIVDKPSGAVDRSMGDVHPMGNPHYWLSPPNAVRIAMQIAQKLEQLRPADAQHFRARLDAFKVRMNEGNKRWLAALAPHKGAKIVTYHRSWTNFVRHFGLDVIGYVEPKPGVPPSPAHLFELTRMMKAQQVKAVVMEPYFDHKTPQAVAERTGAKVVVLYPSVGGARSGTDDTVALFDTNVATLLEALR